MKCFAAKSHIQSGSSRNGQLTTAIAAVERFLLNFEIGPVTDH
jgi:hypothetical protein